MTNKEAIRNLENWELFGKKIIEVDGDLGEAVRMAVKALEQTEVKGDLISREALKSELLNRIALPDWCSAAVLHIIDNAPTVDKDNRK